ncbi:hypothetical protein [Mycolicibacterium aubagnense]|nr:hypothetical protein [Mycolicibacterium aubagnense]
MTGRAAFRWTAYLRTELDRYRQLREPEQPQRTPSGHAEGTS